MQSEEWKSGFGIRSAENRHVEGDATRVEGGKVEAEQRDGKRGEKLFGEGTERQKKKKSGRKKQRPAAVIRVKKKKETNRGEEKQRIGRETTTEKSKKTKKRKKKKSQCMVGWDYRKKEGKEGSRDPWRARERGREGGGSVGAWQGSAGGGPLTSAP